MGLSHHSRFVLLLLLLLFGSRMIATVLSKGTARNLPGYDGDLPFKLETGYVGVGANEDVQLFYYFVESQNKPEKDPLMLWINGGPGCSSLASFFFENGPLTIDTENYTGGLPKLLPNGNSWTKVLNIIFLDAPVGTGFSYSITPEGYITDDNGFGAHVHEFMKKWLEQHQNFLNNPLYLGGEGYSGNPIPIAIQNILDGNEKGDRPIINVKGYAMGNPGTDKNIDFNSQIPVAHRLALISDEIFEDANAKCNGTFFPRPSDVSTSCAKALAAIDELLCRIQPTHVLQPSCSTKCGNSTANTALPIDPPSKKCSKYSQSITETWANNADVRNALQIRQGTITTWTSCGGASKSYNKSVSSVINYHKKFIEENLRGLIYSGDHDLSIPYIATLQWIKLLNLPMVEAWRPWLLNGETGGYTRKLENEKFSLTFTTVKGAGHFAAQSNAEGFAIIERWMAGEPL